MFWLVFSRIVLLKSMPDCSGAIGRKTALDSSPRSSFRQAVVSISRISRALVTVGRCGFFIIFGFSAVCTIKVTRWSEPPGHSLIQDKVYLCYYREITPGIALSLASNPVLQSVPASIHADRGRIPGALIFRPVIPSALGRDSGVLRTTAPFFFRSGSIP